MVTLREVRVAMEANESKTFAGVQVFIVNYLAPCKFTYLGCTQRPGGKPCRRIVEGPFQCQHKSVEKGTVALMYRFSVALVDGSIGHDCPPLHASIWDVGASSLTGMPASEFCELTDEEQVQMINEITHNLPMATAILSVSKGLVSCESLCDLYEGDGYTDKLGVLKYARRTRLSTPRRFRTPLSEFTSFGGDSSSSTPNRPRSVSKATLEEVKSQIISMIETIDLTGN